MNDTTPDMAQLYRKMLLSRSGEDRMQMAAHVFFLS